MFKEILQDGYDRTDDCIMMALLGMDGLAIERIHQPDGERPPYEEDLLNAEYPTLLRKVDNANRDIGFKGTRELIVATEDFIVIINRVGDDLMVVSLVSADGNLGKARYENKKAAVRFEQEL